MAHLVKMILANTSLPPKFHGKCLASRLLTTCDAPLNLNEETVSKYQEKSVLKSQKKFSPLKLKRNDVQKLQTVTGISVTPFAVGWAKIDLKNMALLVCDGEYLKTENTEITETLLCRQMKEIKPFLPESDIYIMERFANFQKQNVFRFQLMASSMLAILLHDSTGPLGEHNVLFQDKRVVDDMFGLAVNGERVSGRQVLYRKLGLVPKNVKDAITIDVDGNRLSTTSNIIKSIFSSKPVCGDISAVALFIVLSFLQANFKSSRGFDSINAN